MNFHGVYNENMRQKSASSSNKNQQGQVALIILLIMVVVLTIGVSIASRTVMDVSLSRQEEQGGRVYQAAESGVETVLSQDLSNDSLFNNDLLTGSLSSINDISVDYTVARKKTLETRIDEGGTVEVDVTGAANGNVLEIQWGKNQGCSESDPSKNVASLLIRIFSKSGGVTTVRNAAYAACSYTNGYPTTGTAAGDNGFFRKVNITLQTNDAFVRVQPLYNDAPVQIAGVGWTLPVQYYDIRSKAKNQIGNETKVVQVSRTLPTYPTVLDYVLYSGTTIVK